MNVLVATDAWHPQINGVVRTLEALCRNVAGQGAVISMLTPEGFPSLKVPTYPGLLCAIPNRLEIARRIARVDPDAIHIATEGPIGFAVRRYCRWHGLPFTTSLTTRFAEYASARFPVPLSWGYAALKWFHAPATATMVSTPSLAAELEGRGFSAPCACGRGASTPISSTPTGPSRSICPGRSSSMSGGSRSRRTWMRSSPRPARHQGRYRPWAASSRTRRALSRTPFPRLHVRREARRPSGRGRRVRLSEPHRHLRHRPARGAVLRRARCRLPGHRAA